MKGRAKESTKEGLICSVREEPNSVQPCQFRFLTNPCQARAANPRKQPEKLGWESGVFSSALRNAFRDPRNSPEKSPEKSSGPRSFRVFWETHARAGSLSRNPWRIASLLNSLFATHSCALKCEPARRLGNCRSRNLIWYAWNVSRMLTDCL